MEADERRQSPGSDIRVRTTAIPLRDAGRIRREPRLRSVEDMNTINNEEMKFPRSDDSAYSTKPRHRLGLPLLGIIGLALLAAPRVVLHDLHLIEEGTFINSLLVYIPPIIWITTVLLLRVPRPFVTLLSVGIFYGIFLAAGHLLFWEQAFPDGEPGLGGNLAGVDPVIQGLLMRGFTAFSSLITGTVIGALTGLLAVGLSWSSRLFRRTEDSR